MSLVAITALMAGLGCDDGADANQVAGEESELHSQPNTHVIGIVNQVNLVADQAGHGSVTDPALVNAWGLAFAPGGRAWVSSNENGLSQVYGSDGKLLLSVAIPPPHGGKEAHPSGQVFNPFADAFKGDRFIFATEDGTISGWQPTTPTRATLRADNSRHGAIYKGVTLGNAGGQPRLYAADFHNNKIDVYDANYKPIHHPDRFVDPSLPSRYAPFNVLAKGPFVFVTYAQQDDTGHDDVKGPGHGFLDVFTADGLHYRRLISHGGLDSPWGMAFGPASDDFSVRLWIGNFGDGRINAFRILIGDDFRLAASAEGLLGDRSDHPLAIDGLWAIAFGPGGGGFAAGDLFFTAGPDDESHGLFGKLVFPTAK
jgi:uncharacterized protein (TIGR03118 family)